MTGPAGWSDAVVDVDGAPIRYRVRGDGPPTVFVHGIYVGGSLWAGLAEQLEGRRCIAPTWPLGAHRDPLADADLSARAPAVRIPALLQALDLRDVTVVGNDTGGGLCLAALGSGHPGLGRVGRMVLTNFDSYEHFPPKGFDLMVKLSRSVPPAGALLLRCLASGLGRRPFLKEVCADPPSADIATRVFEGFASSGAARRDALRVMQSLEPSVTLEAVDAREHSTSRSCWHGANATSSSQSTLPASTFVMLDRRDELAAAIDRFEGPGCRAPGSDAEVGAARRPGPSQNGQGARAAALRADLEQQHRRVGTVALDRLGEVVAGHVVSRPRNAGTSPPVSSAPDPISIENVDACWSRPSRGRIGPGGKPH